MLRSREPKSNIAGFTLIEVLVALSIVAITLTSIGALMANTNRGVRSLEARLLRKEVARSAMAAIPDRGLLEPGRSWGKAAGHDWRVDVLPFVISDKRTTNRDRWLPQSVIVTVQSPSGVSMQINTVRLRRSEGG